MNRIHADSSVFGRTFNALPAGIRRVIGAVDLVLAADPIWIGLHAHAYSGDGRSLSRTSHVTYELHQIHLPNHRRVTTIVLNDGDWDEPLIILHELGHVLDSRLGFTRPEIVPLDSYAATNRGEAFATAFQSWAIEHGENHTYYHTRDQLRAVDPAACAFFDSLATEAA